MWFVFIVKENIVEDKFMPIDPDYYGMFENEKSKKKHSKIQYFKSEKNPVQACGIIEGISKNIENAEFLNLTGAQKIRLDRIIAVNGKPGPAYDEYDGFANACLDCMGGMND